jgi:transposase-like protein
VSRRFRRDALLRGKRPGGNSSTRVSLSTGQQYGKEHNQHKWSLTFADNSAIRKFTRNRRQYANGESALKLVYLAIHEASKRRTMPIAGWKAVLNYFAILLEDRLPLNGNN